MATHEISVTVDTGSIQVDPETLTMSSRDDVRWAGTNARRFSIVFEGAGPFGQQQLVHSAAIASRRPQAKGRFKYSVVSEENPRLKLDPVIIVEEPPTKTNP